MVLNNISYVHKRVRFLCYQVERITGLKMTTNLSKEFDKITFKDELSYVTIDYRKRRCFALGIKITQQHIDIIDEIMLMLSFMETVKKAQERRVRLMGYYDGDTDKADADMLKLRIESFISKKCDKGIDKELITQEESQELMKALKKQIRKHKDVDWWLDQKGNKSYDIAYDLLDDTEGFEYDDQKETLAKIEKA